jgi:outer membrane protein insertion porin family
MAGFETPQVLPPMREAVRKARIRFALLGMAACLLSAVSAHGQPVRETPNRIVEISVEGLVQVEKGQILTAISSRVDGTLDPDILTRDLRSIFSLGYFQNVRADVETLPGVGYRLIFVIKERPRITALNVTGNSIVPTKKILEDMSLKVGSVFTQAALESNLDKIRTEYRDKGYYKVKLTSQVDKVSDQQYAVTIKVEESPRIYITEIEIAGTRVLSSLEVKRLMQSAEVDCFDWITDSGVFDENKINADLAAISAQYLRRGYIRVFIDKPKIVIIHQRDYSRLHVSINITEGPQYFVGTVDITGDILGDKQELLNSLLLKKGIPYSPFDQNQDQFGLSERYGEQGYAFAQVIPDRRINDQTHIVDVTFQIRKGEKAYIGRIEFQGNRETRDFVLRREFQVRENELFNGQKLRESQQNLRILNYFKPSMAVDTEPTEVGNVLDVVTRLEEQQTGTLQAQVGYSDQSGVILAFSITKGNLGGRGQTLRFSTQVAERFIRRSFTVDFIEPHLFDTNYSSESTIGYVQRDDITELNRGLITETTYAQGFGYLVLPRVRLGFNYDWTDRSFSDTDFHSLSLHTLTTSLSMRTVNSATFPTDGTLFNLSESQVGGEVLGGSTEYRRYNLNWQRFYSINRDSSLILMGRMRLGWLEQVNDNVIPIEDRYRIGGIQTIRGYNFLEIGGPYGVLERQINSVNTTSLDGSGNPVISSGGGIPVAATDRRTIGLNEQQLAKLESGGIQQRIFNLELVFPLTGETIRGVVFYDAAQVNAEPVQYSLLKEKQPAFFDLLQSTGFGVRMITPLGVFRFEYGYKLIVQKHESPDKFDFTISSLF